MTARLLKYLEQPMSMGHFKLGGSPKLRDNVGMHRNLNVKWCLVVRQSQFIRYIQYLRKSQYARHS